LYWRYDFFLNFFSLFSFEREEFEPILAEWVEEVLNRKVDATHLNNCFFQNWVEEVLNCKVDEIYTEIYNLTPLVEEVLNCKVDSMIGGRPWWVEQVLNCKINKTISLNHPDYPNVENALSLKLNEIQQRSAPTPCAVEDILNL